MKILLSLLLLTLSSCFQSSKFDTCDRANEKLVRVDGGEKCLPKCIKDSDCKGDDICASSVCAPVGSILTIVTDRRDVVDDVGLKDVSTVLVITDAEADKACADFRQRAVDCTQSQCTDVDLDQVLTIATEFSGGDDCQSSFKDPELLAAINEIGDDCAHPVWRRMFCSVTLETTCETCEPSSTIGEACSTNTDCNFGDFGGVCGTGETDSDVPGGYCVSECSDPKPNDNDSYSYVNSAQCGEGNICEVEVAVDESDKVISRAAICFKGCSRHDQCRAGYGCYPRFVSEDLKLQRVCFPLIPDCDPTICKGSGQCGTEVGPEGVELSVCQLECTPGFEPLCITAGGVCTDPVMDKSFCVLP